METENPAQERSPGRPWVRRIAITIGALLALYAIGVFLISRADGPVNIFAGGPFRTGEIAALQDLDWNRLDALHELEMEIVAEKTSLTLWFSVHEGVPYVACDLDCVGGLLKRWPQQIDVDDRAVIRIEGRRADAQLVHIPHGTKEYDDVRAGRNLKYAGDSGGRAATETAAHSAVVDVGERLTGRASKAEPGDRLYRIDPR